MRTIILIAISLAAMLWINLWPEWQLHEALQLQDNPIENPTSPKILVIGDSHIRHIDWRIVTGCRSIANLGITGNTSYEVLARLPEAIASRPDFVMLMAGTNDPFKRVSPAETLSNIRAMKAILDNRHIAYAVVASPPLPRYPTALDASAQEATLHVPFAESDLAPDKVHLARSGYAKWRDAIVPIMKPLC